MASERLFAQSISLQPVLNYCETPSLTESADKSTHHIRRERHALAPVDVLYLGHIFSRPTGKTGPSSRLI